MKLKTHFIFLAMVLFSLILLMSGCTTMSRTIEVPNTQVDYSLNVIQLGPDNIVMLQP